MSQRDFAAALLNPGSACPPGLKVWNGSDPAHRFAVYRNNVVSSLVDALADTFAVLQTLVGAEFFRAMAKVFVLSTPPRSPLLVQFGSAFPAFVAAFAPAQSVPYLADMARLEIACVQAYHAADAAPVAPDALSRALALPESVAQLKIRLHPSVQVLRSAHAVVSLWSAHQQDEQAISRVDTGLAEDALLLRVVLEVQVLRLTPPAAVFIQSLAEALPLSTAAARALDESPAFDVTASLALLLRLGAITALE
jgi:hypothetical protein